MYDCDLENSALAYAKQCSLVASAEGTRPGEGENVFSGAVVADPEAGVDAVSYDPKQGRNTKGIIV